MCLEVETLAGSCYFSTLDLASGYYNVKVKESDRDKTSFSTKFGGFRHIRLLFGLCNAPATFQRAMELVLNGLTWRTVLVYLDDVIVLGRRFDDHLENLREVFLRFRNANLKLKPVKCIVFQDKTEFLGKLVSKDGIRIIPKKLDTIRNWPVPSNRKQLESFIGYVNYHRAHIQGFAGLMRPLHNLNSDSKNSKVFVWGDDHQEVFIQLKNLLATAPRLCEEK
jgi:hypothetical protein